MELNPEYVEIKNDLLKYIGVDTAREFPELDAMVAGESKFIRDTKFNLKTTLNSEHVNLKESYLLALAVAVNQNNQILADAFKKHAIAQGATEKEIGETHACTSLLSVNNVFYRFRHFAQNKSYEQMQARLKMTLMMNPVLGKEFFELMSLVISAVNGCEMCVNAHENSLRGMGTTQERIFDAIRLGAVVRGLTAIVY
jgi:alkyl hydroperoxide reductase subunit D